MATSMRSPYNYRNQFLILISGFITNRQCFLLQLAAAGEFRNVVSAFAVGSFVFPSATSGVSDRNNNSIRGKNVFLKKSYRREHKKQHSFSNVGTEADYNELPKDLVRREDVLVALNAVRKACLVTQALQPNPSSAVTTSTISTGDDSSSSSISTVEKADFSPVTVADFAVQALVLNYIHERSVNDGFIAEEDSSSLRDDDILCQKVMNAAMLHNKEIALKSVDLGKSYESWQQRPSRIWCLDPIDGTRGFLRGQRLGGQYCIALALIEDGIPVIGVLGCPNLPVNTDDENYVWQDSETLDNNQQTRGCIFVASRGGGCYQLPLVPSSSSKLDHPRRLEVTRNDGSTRPVKDGRFCIGVEKYSDALGQCAGMAKYIHGDDTALDINTGEIIKARRMDSQAKHGVIARGGAEFYARLPKPGYTEWIWDHAAGNVVIEEAGGTMTDTDGKTIDFSLGAQLSPSVRGILMSNGGTFHTALVSAFAEQNKKEKVS